MNMGLSDMESWFSVFLFVLNYLAMIAFTLAIFAGGILIMALGYSPFWLLLAPIALAAVWATGYRLSEWL